MSRSAGKGRSPFARALAFIAYLPLRFRGHLGRAPLQEEGTYERLGDYELLEYLGGGAMADVWRARCWSRREFLSQGPSLGASPVRVGEEVAVKVLKGPTPQSFDRECESLRALKHENIVAYREHFTIQQAGIQRQAIVTELLERRRTLRDLLDAAKVGEKRQGLPWGEVVRVFDHCLQGLTYAQGRGYTHRDIKPSNIIVPSAGPVKVIDFGIAIHDDATRSRDLGPKGTCDYIAPEFAFPEEWRVGDKTFRGDQVSDIFSLGTCMFETLTGEVPYPPRLDGNLADIQFLARWQRWHDGRPLDGPRYDDHWVYELPGVQEFFERALAPDRKDRFQSFDEMRGALQSLAVVSGRTGAYRILGKIGEGGFASVFEAEDRNRRRVAIKKLNRSDLDSEERFRREARVLASHPHAHIVRYVDYIERQFVGRKEMYLVLELLSGMPGSDLAARIKGAPTGLDPDEVLLSFRGLLDAVALLHGQVPPIIHRDIKPSNLYVPEGDPRSAKLMDFGVVRAGSATRMSSPPPGTHDYDPPELFLGYGQSSTSEDLHGTGMRGSPRWDIYALGLCLYKAVTGQPALKPLPSVTGNRSSDAKVIHALLDEVALRDANPARRRVSFEHPVFKKYDGLRALIEKAVAWNPAEGFTTAVDMGQALDEVIRRAAAPKPSLGESLWKGMERACGTASLITGAAGHRGRAVVAGAARLLVRPAVLLSIVAVCVVVAAVLLASPATRIVKESVDSVRARLTAWDLERFNEDLVAIVANYDAKKANQLYQRIVTTPSRLRPDEQSRMSNDLVVATTNYLRTVTNLEMLEDWRRKSDDLFREQAVAQSYRQRQEALAARVRVGGKLGAITSQASLANPSGLMDLASELAELRGKDGVVSGGADIAGACSRLADRATSLAKESFDASQKAHKAQKMLVLKQIDCVDELSRAEGGQSSLARQLADIVARGRSLQQGGADRERETRTRQEELLKALASPNIVAEGGMSLWTGAVARIASPEMNYDLGSAFLERSRSILTGETETAIAAAVTACETNVKDIGALVSLLVSDCLTNVLAQAYVSGEKRRLIGYLSIQIKRDLDRAPLSTRQKRLAAAGVLSASMQVLSPEEGKEFRRLLKEEMSGGVLEIENPGRQALDCAAGSMSLSLAPGGRTTQWVPTTSNTNLLVSFRGGKGLVAQSVSITVPAGGAVAMTAPTLVTAPAELLIKLTEESALPPVEVWLRRKGEEAGGRRIDDQGAVAGGAGVDVKRQGPSSWMITVQQPEDLTVDFRREDYEGANQAVSIGPGDERKEISGPGLMLPTDALRRLMEAETAVTNGAWAVADARLQSLNGLSLRAEVHKDRLKKTKSEWVQYWTNLLRKSLREGEEHVGRYCRFLYEVADPINMTLARMKAGSAPAVPIFSLLVPPAEVMNEESNLALDWRRMRVWSNAITNRWGDPRVLNRLSMDLRELQKQVNNADQKRKSQLEFEQQLVTWAPSARPVLPAALMAAEPQCVSWVGHYEATSEEWRSAVTNMVQVPHPDTNDVLVALFSTGRVLEKMVTEAGGQSRLDAEACRFFGVCLKAILEKTDPEVATGVVNLVKTWTLARPGDQEACVEALLVMSSVPSCATSVAEKTLEELSGGGGPKQLLEEKRRDWQDKLKYLRGGR